MEDALGKLLDSLKIFVQVRIRIRETMSEVDLIIVCCKRVREGQGVVVASIILVSEVILIVFNVGANTVPAKLVLLSLLLGKGEYSHTLVV